MPKKGTIPRVCETCSADFLALSYQIKIGRARYCSNDCRAASTAQPIILSEDGESALVPLIGRGGVARAYASIDAADAEWAGQWTWSLSAGYAMRRGFVDGQKRSILLHRELLGLKHGDGLQGDHIDRNRLNCRRKNLRPITNGGNRQNMTPRGGTSNHRGVWWEPRRNKWIAAITVNGKHTYLGGFDLEADAAEAARLARSKAMPFATD